MEQFSFRCSACGRELQASVEAQGRRAQCPCCRAEVVVPYRSAPGAAPAVSPGAPQGDARSKGELGKTGFPKALYSRFLGVVGLERPEGFSVTEFLSAVFAKHSDEEIDEYFAAGTRSNTPSITAVDPGWPRPWAFSRALAFSLLLYFVLQVTYGIDANTIVLPGLMLVGSFAAPVAMVVFFWEVNCVRNVSLYQVIKSFLFGGVLSVLFASYLYSQFTGDAQTDYTPMTAGPIEEAAKLAVVVFVARSGRYRHQLNGLLLGAAVGAGFAAFESAGYALGVFFDELAGGASVARAADAMEGAIVVRGMFSPMTHVVWSAICAGALWRTRRGGGRFSFSMVLEQRFLRLFVVSVALHALWNAPWELGVWWLKYVALGAVAWGVLIGLMHEGLTEVRTERDAALRSHGGTAPVG